MREFFSQVSSKKNSNKEKKPAIIYSIEEEIIIAKFYGNFSQK